MTWLNEQALLTPAAAVVYRHRCKPEWCTEFVGDGISALTGYQSAEFGHKNIRSLLEIVHPEDMVRVQQALLTPPLSVNEDGYRLEYRIIAKDGSIRHIYDRGRRIFQGGRLAWLTGVLFDLTAVAESMQWLQLNAPESDIGMLQGNGMMPRHGLGQPKSPEQSMQLLLNQLQTIQQQLQQSNSDLSIAHLTLAAQQQRYQDLFNFAPDGYLVTDPTGVIYEANQAIAQLLQTNQQQLMGQSFQDFVVPAQQAQFVQQWQQLMSGQETSKTFELGLRPINSADFPAELTVGLVQNGQQEVVGFRWLVRNITQRKLVEAQILTLNAQLQQRVKEQTASLKRANRELSKLAFVDPLTKVANRRKFDDHLHQEWRRLQRQDTPLTLILCDVDHFKRYNDLYGHPAGDACLRHVAQVLKLAVGRPGDLVARYGGEEFALILPTTTPEGAVQLIEKIRSNLAALQIPNGEDFLTLSFGISTVIPSRQTCQEKLIAAADQALYFAKRNGRNRYAVRNLEDSL